MYTLKKEWIEGTIKFRKNGEIKAVERKKLIELLERGAQKEVNEVKKHDYDVLMEGIMGIEALLIEKHTIYVVYSQKAMWKREGEGIISDNDRLIRFLKEI